MVQAAFAEAPDGDDRTDGPPRLVLVQQLSFDQLRPPTNRKPQAHFKRKMVEGAWSYRCTRCFEWKLDPDFPRVKSAQWGIGRQCLLCTRIQNNALRDSKREFLNSQRRKAHNDRRRRVKEAAKHDTGSCPHFVDRALMMPFVERLAEMHTFDEKFDAQSAAHAANTTSRTISAIRSGERQQVRWSVAEDIAIAVDRLDEFMAHFPEPGLDGWSRAGHRYCRRCRRYDVIHWAKGLCHTCYTGLQKGRWSLDDIDVMPSPKPKPKRWTPGAKLRAAWK